MALNQIREEWRSTLGIVGVQFVMIGGMILMLKSSADNLATDQMVFELIHVYSACLFQFSAFLVLIINISRLSKQVHNNYDNYGE